MSDSPRLARGMARWLFLISLSGITGCGLEPVEPCLDQNLTFEPMATANDNDRSEAFSRHINVELEKLATSPNQAISAWRTQLARYQRMAPYFQMLEVHYDVNSRLSYVPHEKHLPQQDGWGDMECVMGPTGGDCVDFAQSKYLALRHLGWPRERLTMVQGWSEVRSPREMHAVLVATLADGRQFLLDNLREDPLPPGDARDFYPLFAYNELGHFACNRPPPRGISFPVQPAAGQRQP